MRQWDYIAATRLCVIDCACVHFACACLVPGRSSSFGGVPTGRLPGAARSTVTARMLEHGVPSTNEEARRNMTRPPLDQLAKAASSAISSATSSAKYAQRPASPREQRYGLCHDGRPMCKCLSYPCADRMTHAQSACSRGRAGVSSRGCSSTCKGSASCSYRFCRYDSSS